MEKSLKLEFCPETYMVMSTVIFTVKNFYLLAEINDHIDQLVAAGLVKFWHDKMLYGKYVKRHKTKEPKVLSFDHLLGCFQLWGAGCLMSLVVFLMEVALSKWKKRYRRSKF